MYYPINGAVVQWLSVWTVNTGVVSLNPPFVAMKIPLVREAIGNHFIKSTPLVKAQGPVSDFCYA